MSSIVEVLRKLSNDEARILRIAKMEQTDIAESLLTLSYLQDSLQEIKAVTSAKKGKEGEQQIVSYLEMCGYRPLDISRSNSKKGDIEVKLAGGGRVIIEVKYYKASVPSKELATFLDGLPDRGTDVVAGIFVSISSGIAGVKTEVDVQEVTQNDGSNVPVYVLTKPVLQTIDATMKSIEYHAKFAAAQREKLQHANNLIAVTAAKKDAQLSDADKKIDTAVAAPKIGGAQKNNTELVSTNIKLVNERLAKVAETVLALQFDIGKLHTSIFS